MPDNPFDEKNVRSRDFRVRAKLEPKHGHPDRMTLILSVSDGPATYQHYVPSFLEGGGENGLTAAIAEGCNRMIEAAQEQEAGHWIEDHEAVNIVVGRTGQGPDAQTWNVKAFLSAGRAEGACDRLNDWCEGMGLDPGGRRTATMIDPQGDVVRHPEDPNFRIDGGTEYEVVKVPLDMFDPIRD